MVGTVGEKSAIVALDCRDRRPAILSDKLEVRTARQAMRDKRSAGRVEFARPDVGGVEGRVPNARGRRALTDWVAVF